MAHPKKRPVCPKCGGISQKTLTSGLANDQTIPVQYVTCLDCNYHGLQATVWLPDDASLHSLDEDRRRYNRTYRRIQRNRLPQVHRLQRRTNSRITSDTLEVVVRVIPGILGSELSKRMPALKRRKSVVIDEEAA